MLTSSVTDTIILHHGAHTRFTLHVGQCYTPSLRSAQAYADTDGVLAAIALDLSGLEVYEIEGYDREEDEAPGDRGVASLVEWGLPIDGSVDVIIYQDEDVYGRPHKTYRLMSERAVMAAKI